MTKRVGSGTVINKFYPGMGILVNSLRINLQDMLRI
jgi:hypothetical protein